MFESVINYFSEYFKYNNILPVAFAGIYSITIGGVMYLITRNNNNISENIEEIVNMNKTELLCIRGQHNALSSSIITNFENIENLKKHVGFRFDMRKAGEIELDNNIDLINDVLESIRDEIKNIIKHLQNFENRMKNLESNIEYSDSF